MSHDRAAAKAKEIETRKRLGPRLGHKRERFERPTAPTRTPRATGAAGAAIRDGSENNP